MKSNLSLIVSAASFLLIASCSNSSDKKSEPPSAPKVQALSEKDGSCSVAATMALIAASQTSEAYNKDPSVENFATAKESCNKLLSLVGDNSCLMTSAEPQFQLNKETAGQICFNVNEKIKSDTEQAAQPEVALEKILNYKFNSNNAGGITVDSKAAKDGRVSANFRLEPNTEGGFAFEAELQCSYFDSAKNILNTHATQTAYNGEKTIVKSNGDVVRLCNGEEVKVGQKIKNEFSFKTGYCGGLKDGIDSGVVNVKIVSEDKIEIDLNIKVFGKVSCSAVLTKETQIN